MLISCLLKNSKSDLKQNLKVAKFVKPISQISYLKKFRELNVIKSKLSYGYDKHAKLDTTLTNLSDPLVLNNNLSMEFYNFNKPKKKLEN